MFLRSLFALLCLLPHFIYGQSPSAGADGFTAERVSGKNNHVNNLKTACDPATTSLMIISCTGATTNSGNSNASDGASMEWVADGAQNLYYSQIYNTIGDTFRIVQPITGDATYVPDADGSYTAEVDLSTDTDNCLAAGSWTVRVWDVMDDDNDGNPDVDGAGNIIGCYVECSYTYFPECPAQAPNAFTARIDLVSCDGDDGAIRLRNFSDTRFYCSDNIGTGLDYEWSGPAGFSATSRDIIGIGPGDYNVTVTDQYGCPQVNTFTVDEVAMVELACGPTTPPTSVFQMNGTAPYTISDGTGPYNLRFTGPMNGSRNNVPAGDNTLFGLTTGTYTLTVTDVATGCTSVCTAVVGPPPCLIDFTVTYTAGPGGVLTVTIAPTGGTAPFELSWTGPTNSPAPLSGIGNAGITLPGAGFVFGTYTFTLSERFNPGCSADVTITFQPQDCSDIVVTTLQFEGPNCNGGSDGVIELGIAGGENTVIEWAGPGVDGATTPLLENLGAGSYSYTVTDDRGCSLTDGFIMLDPAAFTLTCAAVDETANDNNDGMIDLTLAGGAPPFSLDYTGVDEGGNDIPGQTGVAVTNGFTVTDLSAGTYNLVITDGNGCVATCESVITEPDCSTPIACQAIDPTVFGGTGSVTISAVDGGEFGFDLFMEPGMVFIDGDAPSVGDKTVGNLAPGTYRVNAFNFGGCTGACDFTIEPVNCTLMASVTDVDPSCSGAADGSATITVTGATTGLVIDWERDEFDGRRDVTDLAPGTYRLSVSDDGGCAPILLEFVIADPDPIDVTINQPTPILCAGDESAVLMANTAGGVGNLSYRWSVDTFPDSEMVSGVAMGTYFVTVTDERGCEGASLAYTVLEPTALALDCNGVSETELGQDDGKIGFVVSGGVQPYQFSLDGTSIARPAQDTFRNLAPGTYTIVVTDRNMCTMRCQAIVPAGGCGTLSVSVEATQTDCNEPSGSATATLTGGEGLPTYAWSHGPTSQTVTNLTPGMYTVTVTDELGCAAIGDTEIRAFTDFPVADIGEFSPSCRGGCTTIRGTFTGAAPFTVLYETGGALPPFTLPLTVTGLALTQELCPGDFGLENFTGATVRFIRVTDANGCSVEIDELRSFTTLDDASALIRETRCALDTLTIEGRTFQEDNPTGTFTSATPSAAGCDSVITVDLTFLPAAVGTFAPEVCGDEPVTLGGETFSPARPSGMVVLPGASSLGCDSTVMVSVTYLAPAFSAQTPTICETGSLVVGSTTFDIDNPSGTVTLMGAAANGCDSIVEVNLSFAPPAITIIDTLIGSCQSITVGSEIYDRPVQDTVITLAGAAAGGCDSIVNLSIAVLPDATLVLSGSGLVCDDNLAVVEVTYNGAGSARFTLSGDAGTIRSAPNGTTSYTVTAAPGAILRLTNVENDQVCPTAVSGEVTIAASSLAVTIDNQTDPEAECGLDGIGRLSALASGGIAPYSYRWADGVVGPVRSDLPVGNYEVLVTDSAGCFATAVESVTLREAFGLEITTTEATCADTFATITILDNIGGAGPFVYSIDGAGFLPIDSFPAFLRARPGATSLEVEDAMGCRTVRAFNFDAPILPTLQLTPSRATVPLGDSVLVTLSADFALDSFTVTPAPGSPAVGNSVWLRANEAPQYRFSATNELNCIATATFQLITDRAAPVYAPTAFSPNGDGVNDLFRVFASGQVATINTMTVHNRWGGQVFELSGSVAADDQFWGWGGSLPDGASAPPAVYLFAATATLINGDVVTLRGEIMLLR